MKTFSHRDRDQRGGSDAQHLRLQPDAGDQQADAHGQPQRRIRVGFELTHAGPQADVLALEQPPDGQRRVDEERARTPAAPSIAEYHFGRLSRA